MGKFLSTFAVLLVIWIALTGTAYPEVLAGVVLAIIISTIVSTKIMREKVARMTPKGFLLLLMFIPKFILYEIINHLKLLRIIYSPKFPIDPGIVEVPLGFKKDLQITSVATAVTMLPGTFTLDYDNGLFIHAINKEDGPVEFTHRLEKELGRAFS